MICDRSDCSERGGMRCQRCRCAAYCSRQCQKMCYADHKDVCLRQHDHLNAWLKLMSMKDYDRHVDHLRKNLGLIPSEVWVHMKYPIRTDTIPLEIHMRERASCSRKVWIDMKDSSVINPCMQQVYDRYPVHQFYLRKNPDTGIVSAARVFGVAERFSDIKESLLWTCGCRFLNDAGRRMLKSEAECENIFVPVKGKYLSKVDTFPPELEISIRSFSKTPAIYLDPLGWMMALDAFHDHDKKCAGCGDSLCASCGRTSSQNLTDSIASSMTQLIVE